MLGVSEPQRKPAIAEHNAASPAQLPECLRASCSANGIAVPLRPQKTIYFLPFFSAITRLKTRLVRIEAASTTEKGLKYLPAC